MASRLSVTALSFAIAQVLYTCSPLSVFLYCVDFGTIFSTEPSSYSRVLGARKRNCKLQVNALAYDFTWCAYSTNYAKKHQTRERPYEWRGKTSCMIWYHTFVELFLAKTDIFGVSETIPITPASCFIKNAKNRRGTDETIAFVQEILLKNNPNRPLLRYSCSAKVWSNTNNTHHWKE